MIGRPVSKVRSPPLLEQRLAELGVEAAVEIHDLAPDALEGFLREVRADPSVDGLLVTMPHKRSIAHHLDALSPTAALVESVNTVKRGSNGTLVGAQFDGTALVNALAAADARLAESRVLLLGVGGAGMAIAQAIAAHGCRRLTLADLNPSRAESAVERLGSALIQVVPAPPGGDPHDHDLLINATPIGMTESDPSPFSERQVGCAACVADIVSDPSRTRLAALARQVGTTLVSGRDMVRGQIAPIADWLLHDRPEQS